MLRSTISQLDDGSELQIIIFFYSKTMHTLICIERHFNFDSTSFDIKYSRTSFLGIKFLPVYDGNHPNFIKYIKT